MRSSGSLQYQGRFDFVISQFGQDAGKIHAARSTKSCR